MIKTPYPDKIATFTASLLPLKLLPSQFTASSSILKSLVHPSTTNARAHNNKELCILAMFESTFSLGFLQQIILLWYSSLNNLHNIKNNLYAPICFKIWVWIWQYIKGINFIDAVTFWPHIWRREVIYTCISNQYYIFVFKISDILSINMNM